MNIKRETAQNIVEKLKDVLNQELNFIDTDGIIIASTDKKRIGKIHEAALQVIKTETEVTVETNGQFSGTKKGINAPILLEGEVIGVIGITGSAKEVRKYMKILKNMTEILVREAYIQELSYQKKDNQRVLMDSILLSNEQEITFPNLIGFDIQYERQIIVGQMEIQNKTAPFSEQQLINFFHSLIRDDLQEMCVLNNTTFILAIRKTEKLFLLQELTRIQLQLKKKNILIKFGVGTVCNSANSMRLSYDHAKEALDWTKYVHQEIIFYSDMDIGLLVPTIPVEKQGEFLNRTFQNMPPKKINKYGSLFQSYCKNNGSLAKMSQDLFIHKNTVQYQLIKLKEETGYDPRILNDFFILKLAFLIEESYSVFTKKEGKMRPENQ